MTTESNLRQGFMFVLSSPSGAGKTTIARHILEKDSHLALSVSVTTRPMRSSEVDHKDYHFVDETQFKNMVQAGEFLEHAEVMGYNYGTPRAIIEKALQAGQDVLFDIDWQGLQQLKQAASGKVVSVFILPPSWEELERRLHTRAQDSTEIMQQRMDNATAEISHWSEYDYIIVNEDLDRSVTHAHAILQSERLRRTRQLGLQNFINKLVATRNIG